MNVTAWMIFAVAVFMMAYNVVAYKLGGIDMTISYTFRSLAREYPIIPFILGIIFGHILWGF